MNITIRRATEDDSRDIYRFVCELEETIFDPAVFYKCYMHNISNEKNHYLVAVYNDELIGYLSCHGQLLLHHLGWVYEIQELYVEAQYRSKSIGKHLVQTLEKILSKEPYDTLELTSNVRRTDAHRFYLNNGFSQTHLKFTKKNNH